MMVCGRKIKGMNFKNTTQERQGLKSWLSRINLIFTISMESSLPPSTQRKKSEESTINMET